MYKDKEVVIKLSSEAEIVYNKLNSKVGEEQINGVNGSFHQTLFRSVERIKEQLRRNPFAGNQIPKRQIPSKYIIKYGAENVWRIELADRWRMIYTITGNQIEIIAFIMDIFNHRDYDKVFGYKH